MRVFLTAGEASGDRLGAALMAGLRRLSPDVSLAGIGGPEMGAAGLRSLFPMEELSVMGIAEVLPRLRRLLARIDETARRVAEERPDVLVTIDSPDFSLRVARRVRAMAPGIPIVHYVAPSVWAWRPGRARRLRGRVDRVLALLPFEPPYLEDAGVPCTFVGHPVVAEPVATPAEASAFRDTHGIAPDAPLLLVLPGSRPGEVQRLVPPFGHAVRRVADAVPGLRVVVPAAPQVADMVRAAVRGWPGGPVVLDPRAGDAALAKRAAFRAADAALAASGTVSLELAAAGTPMVIGYDMNWLSRRIIGAMLKVDTVTLVNLVSGTRAVPEFLGDALRPEPVAAAVAGLLSGGPGRTAQEAAFAVTMERLGKGAEPPGLRAARAVLEVAGQGAGTD